MNFFKVAGRDISSIFKNRFIRVSVIAIIVVPLLYSLLYLYAFWDPYNRLQDLPVAVVNMDKGATKDGEPVNYGKDLVDKLKDNNKIGWRFVSKEEAEKGLKDKNGYYAMFVVPEDFSTKVISAKDGKPQEPSILYSSNDKKSFLASQINGKVLVELKSELTKNIVDEYTKVTFDNLYDVKDGMQKASDGSKELYDGVGTLNDKVPELKDGVNKLADGSGDLNSGLGQALAGTVKLANGANDLNTGINQAKDGSNQLKDGLGTLQSNMPGLKDGASKLYDGSAQLNDGLNQVKGKVDGAITFMSTHPELQALMSPSTIQGTKQIMKDGLALKDADTSLLNLVPSIMTPQNMALAQKTIGDVKAISPNLQAIQSDPLLKQLPQLMTSENMVNINSLMKDTDDLAKIDMTKLAPLTGLLDNSDDIMSLMTQASSLGKMDTSKLSALSPLLKPENAKELNKLLTDASKLADVDLSNPRPEDMQALVALQNEFKADSTRTLIKGVSGALTEDNVTAMGTMLKQLTDMQVALNTPENQKLMATVGTALSKENVDYLKALLPQLQSMQQDLVKNQQNLQAVKALLAKANDPATQDTINKVQVLIKDLDTAKPILAQLESQMTPENMQKLAQTPALVGQLQTMQKDLQNNAKILEVAQSALNDGNVKMAEDLVKAIPDLTDGVNRLYKGSSDLKDGLNKLNGNVPSLADGVSKLYAGSNTLAGGLSQLSDGSGQLKNAVGIPNDNILSITKKFNTSSNSTLMDGMDKLYDGSTQLKDGLGTLKGNIPELQDGVGKLYDGSKELSDKLKEGSDKINKNLVNDSKTMAEFVSEPLKMDEEPAYAIKNYGTGFTPYFIPLSLWVGALMMFFVISDDVDSDVQAGSASIVLGKFLTYGVIGTIQALLASSIVIVLGLQPANVPLYFLFNILLSLVFVAIIQCLIFLMGQVGRLLSIVLLILQLTACAGTFPLEVVPTFFKILNPFMPFTYAVSGLREVIAGMDYSVFMKDVTVLATTMAAFLFISVLMKGHADRVKERIKQAKESATIA